MEKLKFLYVFLLDLMDNTEGLLCRSRKGKKMLGLMPNPSQNMQPACPQPALVRASVASVSSQGSLARTTTAAGSQELHGHAFLCKSQ